MLSKIGIRKLGSSKLSGSTGSNSLDKIRKKQQLIRESKGIISNYDDYLKQSDQYRAELQNTSGEDVLISVLLDENRLDIQDTSDYESEEGYNKQLSTLRNKLHNFKKRLSYLGKDTSEVDKQLNLLEKDQLQLTDHKDFSKEQRLISGVQKTYLKEREELIGSLGSEYETSKLEKEGKEYDLTAQEFQRRLNTFANKYNITDYESMISDLSGESTSLKGEVSTTKNYISDLNVFTPKGSIDERYEQIINWQPKSLESENNIFATNRYINLMEEGQKYDQNLSVLGVDLNFNPVDFTEEVKTIIPSTTTREIYNYRTGQWEKENPNNEYGGRWGSGTYHRGESKGLKYRDNVTPEQTLISYKDPSKKYVAEYYDTGKIKSLKSLPIINSTRKYSPYEISFDESGNIQKEVMRDIFVSSDIRTRGDSPVINRSTYEKAKYEADKLVKQDILKGSQTVGRGYSWTYFEPFKSSDVKFDRSVGLKAKNLMNKDVFGSNAGSKVFIQKSAPDSYMYSGNESAIKLKNIHFRQNIQTVFPVTPVEMRGNYRDYVAMQQYIKKGVVSDAAEYHKLPAEMKGFDMSKVDNQLRFGVKPKNFKILGTNNKGITFTNVGQFKGITFTNVGQFIF